MEEKGVPNDTTLVQKSAHEETHDGNIGTFAKNEHVEKTICFRIDLNT